MNSYADRTYENKSQSMANAVTQKHSGESSFQFIDNRPEAIVQMKLQEMGDNHTRKNASRFADNRPIQLVRDRRGAEVNTDSESPDELQAVINMVNQGEAFEEFPGEVHRLHQRIVELRGGRFRSVPIDEAYNLSWNSMASHSLGVNQSNPSVKEDTREQGTSATLRVPTPSGYHPVSGRSGRGPHAESSAYDQVWHSAGSMAQDWINDESLPGGPNQHYTLQRQFFDQMMSGASVSCDGHKASCFICSGIAGSMGVTVELSDLRGYGLYALPDFIRESPDHLRRFIGEEAFAYYLRLTPTQQAEFLRNIGHILYEKHKGAKKNFDVSGFPDRKGGGPGGKGGGTGGGTGGAVFA